MFNAYHLASWKFMRCLQCFLEYEFVLFQIITKKHIHLWSKIIASGTARMELKNNRGVRTSGIFSPIFTLPILGVDVSILFHVQHDRTHPDVPIHQAVLWKSSSQAKKHLRKTSRICFRNWPADEILIGERWAGLNYSKEHVQCSLYHLISQYMYVYIIYITYSIYIYNYLYI